LAFGLKWNASSEIVVFDQEYPSNLYPWLTLQRRDSGVKLHQVPSGTNLGVPREPFLSLLNERTRLVSLSWVQFQTGARLDIPSWSREIRKRAPQALIVVDAMQGLGLHPMSWADWDVDALVGGSYKWLTSPVGVAFLVVKPDLLEKLEPILIGSATFGTCDDAFSTVCSPKTDASRFESGSKQSLDIMALGASLEMILQCGVQTIEKEALRLADRLRAGLIDLGCTLHSPELTDGPSAIVNFSGPVSVERIAEAFDREKVLFARRGPGLRLSPGAFTKDREIDLALSTIQAIGD
jgi:selenocysteine lyase/cysteine desulfurase